MESGELLTHISAEFARAEERSERRHDELADLISKHDGRLTAVEQTTDRVRMVGKVAVAAIGTMFSAACGWAFSR